jgi:predicted nuclease of predicted toxin-antitoxin system
VFIKEVAPGADDDTVLNMANDQHRILLTEDKDFGELVVRHGLPAYSIVLLRLNPADSFAKLIRLRDVIESHGDQFAGSFVVVDETKIRFRPLKTT